MASPKKPGFMGWRGLPQNRTPRPKESSKKLQAELAQQRMRRTGLVMAAITMAAVFMGYRLFFWQVIKQDELLELANRPTFEFPDTVSRGTIRDRNGYMLAGDEVSYKFGVSPNIVSYPDRTADRVTEITGISREEILGYFNLDAPYAVISETLPYTMGQELVRMDENFFIMETVLNRSYPNGNLASHLLGFVNAERRGLAGVEMYYNDLLNGEESVAYPDSSPAEEIKLGHRPFTPTRNGVDLVLTIDRAAQFMVEQELARAVDEYDALGGTIIVMDPETGDILAMASNPAYDPNSYSSYLGNPEIFQDPAVSQLYEPGSVFKIVTVAGALDAGIVSPETTWSDPGVFEVGGRIITNWDGRAYGPRTVTEILGFSLNTGTAWLSTTLGAERFYHYVNSFGFTSPTGLDVGSEASSLVKAPGDGLWHASDLGTNAFGQGIAITPIQMISAVASLLNDGQLMQPRLVRAIVNHGHLQEMPVVVRGQSVSPQVAQAMQRMMAEAVEIETQTALLEQWQVGGKTGTAQVPIPGGYHATDTIASFIGFAPADDPEFIVLVKLNRPLGIYQWGSMSAAPTFQRLTQRLLNYYNVPPDEYRMALQPQNAPADIEVATEGAASDVASPEAASPDAAPPEGAPEVTAEDAAAPPPEPTPVFATPAP